MRRFCIALVVTLSLTTAVASQGQCGSIPMIDAHSQLAGGLDEQVIVPLMDKAGVALTLLSARNDRKPEDVLSYASQHPDRIIPMVRTKGKAFNNNQGSYYILLEKQLENTAFKGMAEILLFHAQKGKKAPEISVFPDEPQARYAIEACIQKGWPAIIHIEFAAAKSKRQAFMKQLKTLLAAHPDHPFILIHMAQLGAKQAGKLLQEYPNVHFMTSHCNPVSVSNGKQPWVNIFKEDSIAPEWQALMKQYPQQFVLAFDNVWPQFWGKFYVRQARLWQAALQELPEDVAHAVAHKNAERLWKLAPQ